jgi:putative membrane protein
MLTQFLADGPGWHGGPWFLLFPLFWIAVLVLARRLLFRGAWAGRGPRGRGPWQDRRWQERGGPAPTPVETLNRKYADGEIDEFEYRTRLSVLTGEDETP